MVASTSSGYDADSNRIFMEEDDFSPSPDKNGGMGLSSRTVKINPDMQDYLNDTEFDQYKKVRF